MDVKLTWPDHVDNELEIQYSQKTNIMDLPSQKDRINCTHWLFNALRLWLLETSDSKNTVNSSEQINWDVLGKMARYHNLEPLLHDLLRKKILSMEGIPESQILNWEKAYLENIFHNKELLDLLSRFQAECRQKNISIIVLKGFSSLALFYKDPGLRTMIDLDILCRKKDLKILADIAVELGCLRTFDDYFHHLGFADRKLGTPLELHFDLYDFLKKKSVFLNLSWKKKKWFEIEGMQIPGLPVENQLVFEVAHIVNHYYFVSIKHYLDFIGKLHLLRKKIDWDYLAYLLSLTGMEKKFFNLCFALSEIMNVPIQIPLKPNTSSDDRNVFKNRLTRLSSEVGFVKYQTIGKGVARQKGVLNKAFFIYKRLVPSLSVIQAVYNTSSRTKAILLLPHFIFSTVKRFRQKKLLA